MPDPNQNTTIPQPITSGSDQAGGGSPASTNIPPAPDAQNDAVKQSIVDAYPNSGPNVSNPNPQMPTLAQPNQPQAPIVTNKPVTPAASMHARLFDSILTTLSGGPITVQQTDDQGNVRTVQVPQSRRTMANSVVAGVLTSLFSGAQGRGASPDYKPVMGANGTQHAEQEAAAQKLVDDNQDRKMKVVKSNLETIQTQLASARMAHEQQALIQKDGDQQTAMAREYDANKDASEPQAIQTAEPVGYAKALDMIRTGPDPNNPNSMAWIAVPSGGMISHLDPQTGKTVSEPGYIVMDPHVRVKLTADDRKMLAATNPQWANVPDGTEVPLTVVNSERLVRGQVHNVQSYINSLYADDSKGGTRESLGLTGDAPDLMTIAQDRKLRGAIASTEQQMAAGAKTSRHYSIMDALLSADGGPDLAAKLGIDMTKARTYLDSEDNKLRAANKVADEAGKIAAQKAKPITFATAPSISEDTTETPERQALAKKVIAEQLDFKTKEAEMKARFAAAKPNPNWMEASYPDGTQVAGTVAELKAAGIDESKAKKLPAADASKVVIARQLIAPDGLLTNTQKDLAAFSPEELTAIGNRWNEFAAGTLGSGDQRYIALRTDSQLLSTALMQAHVGAKGSEFMMSHFADLANAGKMDYDTLKNALGTERRYINEKAMLPKAQEQPTTQSQTQKSSDPAAAFGGKTRQ